MLKIYKPFNQLSKGVTFWLPGLVTVGFCSYVGLVTTLTVGQNSVFINGLIIVYLNIPFLNGFLFFYKENIFPNCSEHETQSGFN